jgi:hypothetical protein
MLKRERVTDNLVDKRRARLVKLRPIVALLPALLRRHGHRKEFGARRQDGQLAIEGGWCCEMDDRATLALHRILGHVDGGDAVERYLHLEAIPCRVDIPCEEPSRVAGVGQEIVQAGGHAPKAADRKIATRNKEYIYKIDRGVNCLFQLR